MRIFITGAAGYLGSALAKKLIEGGSKALLFDSLAYEQSRFRLQKCLEAYSASYDFKIGDIRNKQYVETLIHEFQPDAFVHFGDLSSVWSCNHNPTYSHDVSVFGTKGIIDLCQSFDIPLLYNSSSSLYGVSSEKKLLSEGDLPSEFTDLYCSGKYSMEQYLAEVKRKHSNFRYIAFRPATVFGVSDRFRIELLPNHFSFSALSSGQIGVADLNAYRAFISVETLVTVYSEVLSKFFFPSDVFNIGTYNLTKMEVALAVQRSTECKINTIPDFGDMRNLQISTEKFEKAFGFKREYDFDEEITKVVDWLAPRWLAFKKNDFSEMLNMPLDRWLKLN